MNKARRATIAEAAELISQARDLAEKARDLLGDVHDEEQEAFDNLPESLQQGDRGQAMEQAFGQIAEWMDAIDEFTALDVSVEAVG